MFNELPLQFSCQDELLQGIYSPGQSDVAVLIMVGGPQYRVGSHRQFVKLSRALARDGFSSLRFDFAGMGDSEGQLQPFYANIQAIKLAIDALFNLNSNLRQVVLWGLCDAASAALIYCDQQADSRVAGLVLVNPWVRQQQSHARVMLKHYYWQRLSSKAFWQKLLGGGLNPLQSLRELIATWQQSRNNRQPAAPANTDKAAPKISKPATTADNYVQHMLAGWQNFSGKSLLITSGNDLTAQEFLTLCQNDEAWAACLRNAPHQHIKDANHTFSTADWRTRVEQTTCDFASQLTVSCDNRQ